MKVTACKKGKRYHLDEQEYQQLNGKNHKNGLINKILISITGILLATLFAAAWAGIIKIPQIEIRVANTEQTVDCLRLDVNALIITNTALKTQVEIFLDGKGR